MAARIKQTSKFLHDDCVALRRERHSYRFAGFGQTIVGLALLGPDQNRREFAGVSDWPIPIRRKLHAIHMGTRSPVCRTTS